MMSPKTPDGGTKDDWHLTGDIPIEHGKGDPFAAAIRATRMAMIIADPRLPDIPIVFVNDAFLKLTGYTREEVIGRNCRFLQGPDTDPKAVTKIREAVKDRTDINVDILNYRKDGSTFWNALYISPVFTETNELQFFFSSQLDITERMEKEQSILEEKERFERAVRERTAELQSALEMQTALLHEVDHRVKNNLQMVSSLIVMQSRTIPDENIRLSLRSMLQRVEALSTVHRRLYQSADISRFDLADFARDLVDGLVAASGRRIDIRLDIANAVEVAADKAAPIALILNELVTNAIKHAYVDGVPGQLVIRIAADDGVCRIEVEDNGKGLGGVIPGSDSFGMRLIRSIGNQLDAEMEWSSADPGTLATLTLPLGTKSARLPS